MIYTVVSYKKLVKEEEDLQEIRYQDIIENIKKLVKESDIKQGAIARRAGFTDQSFSDMMNGRKLLRAEYIPQIAIALGKTVNEIYGIKETEQESIKKGA